MHLSAEKVECQAASGLDFVLGDGRGAQGLGMALCIGQEGDVELELRV